ncbi:SRPBCC family protein [Pusillimonas noertemannii]|uniref:SRPBCC family protein n=2 Tax=Pusillimonas noertemannii TaxID=305977 RepID=UPI00334102F7
MELLGQQLIGANRQTVWNALNDPDVLAQCIPGCEEISRLSENQLQLRIMVKIGPVRSRFAGTLTLEGINAPASCTLVFEGTGAAGFAKGGSSVVLSEQGEQTRLEYAAKASVGGRLGQIGGRLIESSARKMSDEFFSAFQSVLSGGTDAGAEAGTLGGVDAAAVPGARSGGAPPSSGQAAPADAGASAGGPAQKNGAAAGRPASTRPAPAEAAPMLAGWRPELYRAFWFCLGVFFTLLVGRWLP